MFWFRTMFVMFSASVVVDCTSEIAKVKSFVCQLQISKSTTLLKVSVHFDAVLFLSLCLVLILYLCPGPLLDQKFKRELKLFLLSHNRRPDDCYPVSRSHYIFFTAQTMMPIGVLLFISMLYTCLPVLPRVFWGNYYVNL